MRGALPRAADLPGVNLTFSGAPAPVVGTKGRALDHIGFEVKGSREFFVRQLEARGINGSIARTCTPSSTLVGIAFLTCIRGARTSSSTKASRPSAKMAGFERTGRGYLETRHLADLTFPEVSRSLRALSSGYVERRTRLTEGAPLAGRGKRAAFALFYGPLHFLIVRHIATSLPGPPAQAGRSSISAAEPARPAPPGRRARPAAHRFSDWIGTAGPSTKPGRPTRHSAFRPAPVSTISPALPCRNAVRSSPRSPSTSWPMTPERRCSPGFSNTGRAAATSSSSNQSPHPSRPGGAMAPRFRSRRRPGRRVADTHPPSRHRRETEARRRPEPPRAHRALTVALTLLGTGDWGLGTGDWGLGTGDWGLGTSD